MFRHRFGAFRSGSRQVTSSRSCRRGPSRFQKPTHSEPEYRPKTSSPETCVTNTYNHKLARAQALDAPKHTKKNRPRGASRLGRELVGASPGLRQSHGLGAWGFGISVTTEGRDYFETERWEQTSSGTPSLRHGGGSDTENESQTIKG